MSAIAGPPESDLEGLYTPATHVRRAHAMRIAILSPPWFSVPPARYGGVEAMVSLLADGLADRGHEVTLFASGDSMTRATLSAVHATAPSDLLGLSDPALLHAMPLFERAAEFDVVSDHTGALGLALSALTTTPFVHTVHGSLEGPSGRLYESIVRALGGNARLTSLTMSQRRAAPTLPWFANVPNAVDLDLHSCRARAGGAYLFWIGRMSPDKGPDVAIRVARAVGLPLILAGKLSEPAERRYFERVIEPLLGDGVCFIGEVDPRERVELLHGARALLFPIAWEEPFGLVMIEAMACGVPVIATRRGSVEEVVEHGRSGLIVDSEAELVDAIGAVDALDPRECRRSVEERFSPDRMIDGYAEAFARASRRLTIRGTVHDAWHGGVASAAAVHGAVGG